MSTLTAAPRLSRPTTVLDHVALRRVAPSIFAPAPFHAMSARYKFIPTVEVVDMLAEKGFRPVRAQQSNCRTVGKGDYTRHMVRFRHDDNLGPMDLNQEVPEVVMTNSHDGSAGYEFMTGIYRLVCLNGLVVQSAQIEAFKVRHTGGSSFHEQVIEATYRVVEDAPKTAAQIESWKGITLDLPRQAAFAEAAASLREITPTSNHEVLRAHRVADASAPDGTRDLWRTFNAVQENLLRGGIGRINDKGRRGRTRGITSVDADIKTNRALWVLAERMAEIVTK